MLFVSVVVSKMLWLDPSIEAKGQKGCSLPGSNWRPSDYETDALPTEPKEPRTYADCTPFHLDTPNPLPLHGCIYT